MKTCCQAQQCQLLWALHSWPDPSATTGLSLQRLQERLSEVLEQVLDENSPRWITGVKLTRLTMGDKVQHAGPTPRWVPFTPPGKLRLQSCEAHACCQSIGWSNSPEFEEMSSENFDLKLHVLRTSGCPNAAAGGHLCEGVQGTLWSIAWA